jgi:hypothetical protein
VGLIGGG